MMSHRSIGKLWVDLAYCIMSHNCQLENTGLILHTVSCLIGHLENTGLIWHIVSCLIIVNWTLGCSGILYYVS